MNARIAARSACAVGSRAPPSRQELFLDFIVRDELAGVRLANAFFDLRDEAETLDGVLDRGVFRQGPKRLDGSLLLGYFHVDDSTIAFALTWGADDAFEARVDEKMQRLWHGLKAALYL